MRILRNCSCESHYKSLEGYILKDLMTHFIKYLYKFGQTHIYIRHSFVLLVQNQAYLLSVSYQ